MIHPSCPKKISSSSFPSVLFLNFSSTPSTLLGNQYALQWHHYIIRKVAVGHRCETQERLLWKKRILCKAEKVSALSTKICFLWFFTAVSWAARIYFGAWSPRFAIGYNNILELSFIAIFCVFKLMWRGTLILKRVLFGRSVNLEHLLMLSSCRARRLSASGTGFQLTVDCHPIPCIFLRGN